MTRSRTWMITGAERGLGRALALAALAEGHSVVATTRGESTLPDHERLAVAHLDVRDRAAAFEAVQAGAARFGSLDVLVSNAGHGLVGAAEEASEAEARAILDVNLLGPLWLSQAAIPIMRGQGSGHIVQISTVGAAGTMPLLGLYTASKWGLEAWSESMRGEVAPFGIRVSLVEPGSMDTDWAGSSMRFADPSPAYDPLRAAMFGSAEVPWPASAAMGGTSADEIAAAILEHVRDDADERLRVLAGDDAPGQVRAALDARLADYARDPRFGAA